MGTVQTVSPVDGSLIAEREHVSAGEIESALNRAARARREWQAVPRDARARIHTRFVDLVLARRQDVAQELAWQMGRPVSAAAGELGGFEERARHMIATAAEALGDIVPP